MEKDEVTIKTRVKWKMKYLLPVLFALLLLPFHPICAYAAPTITILKGDPGSQTSPPYTFTLRVSDPVGIVSITVNGRELNPGGIDQYDIDWNTYYNGDFVITATNASGETNSRTLTISNLTQGGQQARQETTAAQPIVQETQAPVPQTAAPERTTVAPTAAPPAAPTTAAARETRAAQQTTAARTRAETEPEESVIEVTEEETSPVEESETEIVITEAEETEEIPSIVVTEAETPEETPEETVPEIPPDSYRLYPGGKKDMTIPFIIIVVALLVMLYCAITIHLNKKRLALYQQLLTVLKKRKKNRENRNIHTELK